MNPIKLTPKYANDIQNLQRFKEFIEDNKDSFLDLLTNISPYKSAVEEIELTLDTLEGAANELEKHRPPVVDKMAVFMPSNLILYSYVLYLVIPSFYIRNIYFRPSSYVNVYVNQLHKMFNDINPISIEIKNLSQREFLDDYVNNSNIILFTGAYKNAEKIKKKIKKDQMYLFFGQGVNPIIISDQADIDKAVQDVINVRVFNSGQDCLGPDVLFVNESICDIFINKLITQIKELKYGDNQDKNADYGPIYYTSTLEELACFLNRNCRIVHGGAIDFSSKIVEPTVLYSRLEDAVNAMEFYSPIFNVVSYKDRNQLYELLNTSYYRERAMGASVYGDQVLAELLTKKHTVSVDETLMDIEDGNMPFGGYGPMSNYISYYRKLIIEPILLSKAISEYYEIGKRRS